MSDVGPGPLVLGGVPHAVEAASADERVVPLHECLLVSISHTSCRLSVEQSKLDQYQTLAILSEIHLTNTNQGAAGLMKSQGASKLNSVI